ncbi:hypothetical protein [Corallococcus aberystwythensis]|uniref:hypothetical protein n=1 Tax=Corallococcus aberystwythensis TaxID=2316722 RepID=UPI001FC8FAB6|nr:hypothetical protein [Corallococcus aberystwythensis]
MSQPVRLRVQLGMGEGTASGSDGNLGGRFGRSSLDELMDGGQQESSNRPPSEQNQAFSGFGPFSGFYMTR